MFLIACLFISLVILINITLFHNCGRNLLQPTIMKQVSTCLLTKMTKCVSFYFRRKHPVQGKRRMTYPPEALKFAVEEARRTRKLRTAARKYGVPISTVFRMIHNVNIKPKPGKQTILTEQEELRIEQWVLYMARAGFPISMTDLNNTVAAIVDKLRKKRDIPDSFPSRIIKN